MTHPIIRKLQYEFASTLDELTSNVPLMLNPAQLDLLERRFFEMVENIEDSLANVPLPQPIGISRAIRRELDDLFSDVCFIDDPEFTNLQIDVIEMRFRHLVDVVEAFLETIPESTSTTTQGESL